MKLGVFAMIPQLNTKVLNGITSITKWQNSSSSKVKTMLVCFYDRKGIIYHEFVPKGQTALEVFI